MEVRAEVNPTALASAILWTLWSGHPDAALLKQYADSAKVPVVIAWAVAKVESGVRADNHARGTHKEIGRMQLRRVHENSFRTQCGPLPLTDYLTNICVGMFLLRKHYAATGSWEAAIRRYNGGGAATALYLRKVEAEIGRIALRMLEGK